jgi:hypothetical protein
MQWWLYHPSPGGGPHQIADRGHTSTLDPFRWATQTAGMRCSWTPDYYLQLCRVLGFELPARVLE